MAAALGSRQAAENPGTLWLHQRRLRRARRQSPCSPLPEALRRTPPRRLTARGAGIVCFDRPFQLPSWGGVRQVLDRPQAQTRSWATSDSQYLCGPRSTSRRTAVWNLP
jgi:hypothetical protein